MRGNSFNGAVKNSWHFTPAKAQGAGTLAVNPWGLHALWLGCLAWLSIKMRP
jgi:hypothetical protein